MRRIWLVGLPILVGLAASPGFADLSSRYSIVGLNSDGQDYSGTAAFAASNQIYHADFIDSAGIKTSGVAVEYENFLGIAAVARDGSGNLSLYRRADSGWAGIYTSYDDDDNLGSEVLYNGEKPGLPSTNAKTAAVAGTYSIAGTNPDGSTYSGEVEITLNGHEFGVDRTIGKEETTGTAIVFNGALAMNVTVGDDTPPAKIGVVGVFIPQDRGFIGVWNKVGNDRLGAERWVRK
jgi:hypothetical protein